MAYAAAPAAGDIEERFALDASANGRSGQCRTIDQDAKLPRHLG